MTIHHNGTLAAEDWGPRHWVMPAASTAWLANKLLEFGVSLEEPEISSSLAGSQKRCLSNLVMNLSFL